MGIANEARAFQENQGTTFIFKREQSPSHWGATVGDSDNAEIPSAAESTLPFIGVATDLARPAAANAADKDDCGDTMVAVPEANACDAGIGDGGVAAAAAAVTGDKATPEG